MIDHKSHIVDNETLVIDLMNFSPFGPLGQMFVVEAIRQYAKKVAETPVKDDPHEMFSRETWRAIGQDVTERCDAFYNRNSLPR